MHVSILPPEPEPTACTLFKGSVKKALMPIIEPWRLEDQSRLRDLRDSRQARRLETFMLVKQILRFLRAESAGSQAATNQSDNGVSSGECQDSDDDSPSRRRAVPSSAGKKVVDEASSKAEQKMRPADNARGTKKFKLTAGGDDEDDDRNDDNRQKSGPSVKTTFQAASASQRRVSSKMEETEVKNAADLEISALASQIIQDNELELRNARRIAQKLKDTTLTKKEKVVMQDLRPSSLRSTLSGNSVPGRNIRPHQCKKDQKAPKWIFSFKGANGLNIPVWYSTLPQHASVSQLQQLHNELAKLYNAWPHDPEALPAATKQLLVVVAMGNITSIPLQVENITHGDTILYRTKVHCVHPETGAHITVPITITANDSALSGVEVPPMPTLNVVRADGKAIKTVSAGNIQYEPPPTFAKTPLTKNQKCSRWAQQRAEEALYYMASQLQGLVATKERITKMILTLRTEIGLSHTANTLMYGGKSDLYSVSQKKEMRSTLVAPTKEMARDMGNTRSALSLYVYSLMASRTIPVLDTIVQLWTSGADVRYVWIEAAKIADLVNSSIDDGSRPSCRCDCDEEMTGSEWHACESCTHPVLCYTRSWDNIGRLVCRRCHARQSIRGGEGENADEILMHTLARVSLTRNFRSECRMRGLDPDDQELKTIRDEAWKKVKARLPPDGTTYTDEYTKMEHDVGEERVPIGSNPSRRRYYPSGLTLDAIHRRGHHQNQHLKHSGSNLAITSNALQMAKGSFIPGTLDEIGDFLRLDEDQQASSAMRNALVETMKDMARVKCKIPYIVAGTGSDEAKYEKILAESIAGRPTPGEYGPWERKVEEYVEKPVPQYEPGSKKSLFNDKTWNNSQKCAVSMEKYFDVRLARLPDGTAWIDGPGTSPDNFDRNGVAALCRERLERMRLECNKKWVTHDNYVHLYLEILFQYCCTITKRTDRDYKKYGDRLRLPLVVQKHSPLRLSIAHRLHGFGMRTGWVSESPVDVSERLDNDSMNNMLIESWYVNSAKFDMAEAYYGELDEILKNAVITDPKIYKPGVPPTQISAVPTDQEIEFEDEYGGATFETIETPDADTESGNATEVDANDDDEPMPDAAESPATAASAISSRLNEVISRIYQSIFGDPALEDQLSYNLDFRRELHRLEQIADDTTNPNAAGDFDDVLAEIKRDFLDRYRTVELPE